MKDIAEEKDYSEILDKFDSRITDIMEEANKLFKLYSLNSDFTLYKANGDMILMLLMTRSFDSKTYFIDISYEQTRDEVRISNGYIVEGKETLEQPVEKVFSPDEPYKIRRYVRNLVRYIRIIR